MQGQVPVSQFPRGPADPAPGVPPSRLSSSCVVQQAGRQPQQPGALPLKHQAESPSLHYTQCHTERTDGRTGPTLQMYIYYGVYGEFSFYKS